ncbi:MAG: SDR family NAD(P)-dependent oxidoreductase [Polyangiaceae bacterium]
MFRDRVVVIAGACCGVGLAAGHRFARAGAQVVLAGPCDLIREVASEIDASGGDAFFRVADVSNLEDAQALARFALDVYGRIDVWINVADRHAQAPHVDSSQAISRRHWGVVNGSLVALWNMRSAGGTLLNVTTEDPTSAGACACAQFTRVLQRGVAEEALPILVSVVEGHGEPVAVVANTLTERLTEAQTRRADTWRERQVA